VFVEEDDGEEDGEEDLEGPEEGNLAAADPPDGGIEGQAGEVGANNGQNDDDKPVVKWIVRPPNTKG